MFFKDPTRHPSIPSHLRSDTRGTDDFVFRVCFGADGERDAWEEVGKVTFVCGCVSEGVDVDLVDKKERGGGKVKIDVSRCILEGDWLGHVPRSVRCLYQVLPGLA